MKTTIDRLNLHTQDEILVLNEPEDFSTLTNCLDCTVIGSLLKTSSVSCAVLFVTSKQELFNQMITLFPKLTDDSILWIAYPRQTSKSLILELYNHEAWEEIKDYSLQPVRKIELSEDWNALRFRKIEYVKK
ncbi:hypothetical protein FNB79_08370 [Formosa sediminum]|uniref:DUF3052 family protein n=1 Tax=Formosa sediminum TaxID=2594004 RepID=A0A516GR50_9FLAO|nr:hypothetical protein [Formosa sediminum]QDO93996.1 hypothetical protein FNB79_08370 [Formosa sediminum]